MFVSISCDLSNDDHRKKIYDLLYQYGFKKIQKNLFESYKLKEEYLSRLKRDIDRNTDFYDTIRMYQYPLNDILVITTLKEKRWRKLLVK
ncbi:MAG: CRISPR-associated protein Cas2 [Spirochaetia bacterium]